MSVLKVRHNGEWIKVPGGGSGGGAQVQADYTQNDSSAVDYIKNRPFHSHIEKIFNQDIVATDVQIDGMSTIGYAHPTSIISSENMQDGNICTVVMDDTTYTCELKDGCIGNPYVLLLSFLKELADAYNMTVEELLELVYKDDDISSLNTGEPFCIIVGSSTDENGIISEGTIFSVEEAGTYHFDIDLDVIQKLDSKFLPEIDALPTVTADNNGQTLSVVDGTWQVTDAASGLPSVTTADNDKVLMVVNGAWVAGSIANGDEVYY